MAIWVSVCFGLVTGLLFGGLGAVKSARRGDFERANQRLRIGAWLSGICASLILALVTGWPFVSVTESVVEQVSRTVWETVEVPIEVSTWYFWRKTEIRTQEVAKSVHEPIVRFNVRRQFSILALIALLVIGWLGYKLQLGFAWLVWRRYSRL